MVGWDGGVEGGVEGGRGRGRGHPSSDLVQLSLARYSTREVTERIRETGEEETLNRRLRRRDLSDREGGREKSKGEGLGK